MVAVNSGKMMIEVDRRFGLPEALRLRETVERLAPLREVVLEFGAAAAVEDAALLIVAELMRAMPQCRFRLTGLTHHRRRLLRYIGAPETGLGSAPTSVA